MKQSTLNFAAAKRTAGSLNIGKPSKAQHPSATTSKRKPSLPVAKSKQDSSEDEINQFDDQVMLKEASSEEIEDVTSSGNSVKNDPETSAIQASALKKKTPTKPGRDKASNVQPFKTPKPKDKPEDLLKNVDANTTDDDLLPELDPSSQRWNQIYKDSKAKLGGTPIHGKDENRVQHVLRVFDNSYEYGPCIGMTRLERWERAESLGLHPPKEVYEILTTKQGQTLDEYKQPVFHGEV